MAQDTETPKNNTGLSAEQLETLLTKVIAAVKAPTTLEQSKIDAEEVTKKAALENRLKLAESVKTEMANKRYVQSVCSHEHATGQSHCVWIQEKVGPGYILCQKNQCIIRSGSPSANYRGTVIYDTAQFNSLFQKCSTNEELFG